MDRHHTVIVRKPWGYEYLAFKNEHVALWLLNIAPGEKTSMHCHPSKSTGLVLLSGDAEINFISDSKILSAPAKQMIRRGLFHQTHAVGTDPVILFEVETPVDKDDLVRLHDFYGRKHDGYEGQQHELPKNDDCIWFEEEDTEIEKFGRILKIKTIDDATIFNNLDDDTIIMFLNGGVYKVINSREHTVIAPGDVGVAKVVKHVASEMDGVLANTVVLLIR